MKSKQLRKLHRQLAPIMFIPLTLTTITGIIYPIAGRWLHFDDDKIHLLMDIHSGAIFKLAKIYPLLNGLGVIALLVTGLSMTNLFKSRSSQNNAEN